MSAVSICSSSFVDGDWEGDGEGSMSIGVMDVEERGFLLGVTSGWRWGGIGGRVGEGGEGEGRWFVDIVILTKG